MSKTWGLVVSGLLVVCIACGETNDDGGGAGGAAGSSAAGAAGASAGASSGAGTSASGNADPTLCGGAYPDECAAGKVCRFDSGCGTVGHCVRVPDTCTEEAAPVCGCDGKTYGNECGARQAGTAAGSDGACDTTLECGPYRCATGQYCLDKADDEDGPWRYACMPLPEACNGAASCACLTDVKSCFTGFTCASITNGVQLVCN